MSQVKVFILVSVHFLFLYTSLPYFLLHYFSPDSVCLTLSAPLTHSILSFALLLGRYKPRNLHELQPPWTNHYDLSTELLTLSWSFPLTSEPDSKACRSTAACLPSPRIIRSACQAKAKTVFLSVHSLAYLPTYTLLKYRKSRYVIHREGY